MKRTMLRHKPTYALIVLAVAMTLLACCLAPVHDAVRVDPRLSVNVQSGIVPGVVGAAQRSSGSVVLLLVFAPLAIGLRRLSSRRSPAGGASTIRPTQLLSVPLRI